MFRLETVGLQTMGSFYAQNPQAQQTHLSVQYITFLDEVRIMYEIEKLPAVIDIGYVGEKDFRKIEIDMTAWMNDTPTGVPSIVHIRPGESKSDAYVAATTFENNILTWVISDGDLGSVEGSGVIQVWLEKEENNSVTKRGKSALTASFVHSSIEDPSSDVPEAQEAWITQMTSLKTQTVNAAESASDSAEDAEAYAVGTRNGTPVSSDDPTYQNNSKYYSEQFASALNGKVNEPSAEGTDGQVLATDGHGGRTWRTVGVNPETIEEAVQDWLDEHPEATTTVEDGSITKAKLSSSLAGELDGKAPAITDTDEGYSHTSVDEFTIVGNSYAFGNARYANKKDLIELNDFSETFGTVSVESHGNIIIYNGTRTGGSDDNVAALNEVDMPSGTYTFKIEVHYGSSELTYGKNFYLDLWYDGNETSSYDKRITLESVRNETVSNTFTITNHVYKIRPWWGIRNGKYEDYRIFYSLFPSGTTITDIGEPVGEGQSKQITLESALSEVDTMMHKSIVSTVVDTKTYVDNHTQEIDYVYFRPEDYGAKGDGSTDDSTAFQACINAAQANDPSYMAHAVRAYGTYKLSTGIVFNCRELDVYVNKIIYTGNDAAVTISASFSNFEFNTIHAESGGNSNIGIKCYKSADSGWGNYFYANTIKCNFLSSKGHCIYLCLGAGLLNTMMYSRFYVPYLKSTNGNLIHTTKVLGEIDFYGKICNAQNGYLFYSETKLTSMARFFNFSLENVLKNGTNSVARFYHTRSTEMEDLKTPENMNTTGSWFTWDGIVPAGSITGNSSGITLLSLDTTNALTWEGALVKVKEDYENGYTNETPWINWIPSCRTDFRFAEADRVGRFTNAHFGGGIKFAPEGSAIVYYKNVAFIPKYDIYCKVSDDMTIVRNAENGYAYNTPTTFDIDASSVTITLDCSYCCIAIKEFKVIQHTGKTAIVVDKLGNTIFDGTNLGEGVFHFKCSLTQYEYGDVYVVKDDQTVCKCPATLLLSLYDGTNEKWTVTKETLIEPPAQS